MPQTGIEDPQGLVGPRDQQATRGETERLSQGTRLEERTPEIGGVEEIATGRTTTGKRNPGLMRARAEKVVGTMEQKEQDNMAIGGVPEDTARGFQTWGNLLQATL